MPQAPAGDKSERLGDAPIQPSYHRMMNRLAELLDQVLNGTLRGNERKTGWVLLVFPFDDQPGVKSRANYISNARREDVVALLKEQVARFEGQPEIEGHG